MAKQYYRKPTALAGGNQTFTGWTIPSALDITENGTYSTTNVWAQSVNLVGPNEI